MDAPPLAPAPAPQRPPPAWPAALCVLASGSRGNCTALVRGEGDARSVILIDAGLSPRRTAAALHAVGLSIDMVRAVVFTHLDHDHAHPSWGDALPAGAALHIHRRHMGRAERAGLLRARCEPFEDELGLPAGVRGLARVLHHDDLGVVCFRFLTDDAEDLGFATDVGRVSPGLIEHLAGVGVLAIESNYCPELQASSARPDFLKRRITAGHGHLSNHQCVEAVRRIDPRRHVVALHLSRECNRVELVAALHEGADYALTVAEQDRPTRWIGLPRRPAGAPPASGQRPVVVRDAPRLFHPRSATLPAHERQ